ncbi:probable G-protein coupled receptor 139 [Rhincodon typus]|uniref:probable G-protein coupled receptor 139 n=1 Tax=Rhincodon typus TaxID=259920 RepID=UPI00202FCFFE|nr:probable G-protein coupled receptor 139 [Rhincodon typus]
MERVGPLKDKGGNLRIELKEFAELLNEYLDLVFTKETEIDDRKIECYFDIRSYIHTKKGDIDFKQWDYILGKCRLLSLADIIVTGKTNLVAIVILSRGKCGLSRCVTYYLVAIAVSDFLVIITGCILNRISRIYFTYSALSTTTGCALSAVLVYFSRDGSVWLTVSFTIDRFVSICCQNLKNRYCTKKTASLVIGIVCLLNAIKNVPFYFSYNPLYTLDGVPWFCEIKSTYYTSLAWRAYDWLDHILMPFLPFFLILLLNVLTVHHILTVSQARRRLQGNKHRSDPELASRKKSIVLLFTISLSFLLLWVIQVVHFLYVHIPGKAYFSGLDFNDPDYLLQEATNMLQIINSCNNVFIYAVAQKRFRGELKKLLMCPIATVTSCYKE